VIRLRRRGVCSAGVIRRWRSWEEFAGVDEMRNGFDDYEDPIGGFP